MRQHCPSSSVSQDGSQADALAEAISSVDALWETTVSALSCATAIEGAKLETAIKVMIATRIRA
jgi:hypothetical protein